MEEKFVFCKGGGCTAKLGPAALNKVLEVLPKMEDPNLLVGFESSDDAAVYKLNEEMALVHTLDFFPPMLDDPYIFGQVAATNALSDVYAMGGKVLSALNIVCFPESQDLNMLGEILRGGSDKVIEAGAVLVGGHSINDTGVKYGLSVSGIVDPKKIYKNNACKIGDVLILTKPLGVGLVCSANRLGEASKEAMDMAIKSMTTLNKYSAEIVSKYKVNACTDVTGFSLLGHLSEMVEDNCSAIIETENIPYIKESFDYANEFYFTAAAQRNRNHVGNKVEFEDVEFAMEEILFDPQTSGGLLISLAKEDAKKAIAEIKEQGLDCGIIGEIVEKREKAIYVK